MELAAFGNSRVVLHLEQDTVGLVLVGQHLGLDLVGVDNHRAQLVALENFPFTSDSTLFVENRAAILMLDGDSSDKDNRGGENEEKQRSDDVEGPLEPATCTFGLRLLDMHQRQAGHWADMHALCGDVGESGNDD